LFPLQDAYDEFAHGLSREAGGGIVRRAAASAGFPAAGFALVTRSVQRLGHGLHSVPTCPPA